MAGYPMRRRGETEESVTQRRRAHYTSTLGPQEGLKKFAAQYPKYAKGAQITPARRAKPTGGVEPELGGLVKRKRKAQRKLGQMAKSRYGN